VWEPLGGVLHISNCITAEEGYVFMARGLTEVGASPEGTEQLAIRRVPFAEALRMVDAGEITDAVSVIALLRASRLRE
jgi:hypothetical protein